ncbi:unnamed protein product [Blepharisma stoltei]|uniref:Uncharacterized protein n=1 Tax=Blepharisma stoltei TaxID=1481888 RepID=A0AAU9IP16_9CILI|nr:unnamed protein product [Blepharisma stoltei]
MSFEKVNEKDTLSELSSKNNDPCSLLSFHNDFLHFGSLFSSQLTSENEKAYSYFKDFADGEDSLKLLEFIENSRLDSEILQIYCEMIVKILSKKWSLFPCEFISMLSKIVKSKIFENIKDVFRLKTLKECCAKLTGEIYFQENNEDLWEFVIGNLDLSYEHIDISIDIIKYIIKRQNIMEKLYIKDFHRKISESIPMTSMVTKIIESWFLNKSQNSELGEINIQNFISKTLPSLFVKLLQTLETSIDDTTNHGNKIEIIQKIICLLNDILQFDGKLSFKNEEIDEIYSKNIFLIFFKLFENFLALNNPLAAANCLQFIGLNQEKIIISLNQNIVKYHMLEIIKGITVIFTTKFGLDHEIVYNSFIKLISKLDHKEIAHNNDFYMEISSFTINALQSKNSKKCWLDLINFWKNLSENDCFMNRILKQTSWDIWKIYVKIIFDFEDEGIWSHHDAKLVVVFKISDDYYQEFGRWILKHYNVLMSADIEYENCTKLIKLIYIWCSIIKNEYKNISQKSLTSMRVNYEKFCIHQEMLENVLKVILAIEDFNNIFSHPLLQPCLYFIKCFIKLYCSRFWSQTLSSSFIDIILVKIYQEFLFFKVNTHPICLQIFTKLIKSIHYDFNNKNREIACGIFLLKEIHVIEIMRLYAQYILKSSSKISKIRADFSFAMANLYSISKEKIDLFYLLTPISILLEISVEELSYIYQDLKGIIRALNNSEDFEIFFDWFFLNENKMSQIDSDILHKLFIMQFIKEFIGKFIIFADNFEINKTQIILAYSIKNLDRTFTILANSDFTHMTKEKLSALGNSIDTLNCIIKYKINHPQQNYNFKETINLANATINHYTIEILCAEPETIEKCCEFIKNVKLIN